MSKEISKGLVWMASTIIPASVCVWGSSFLSWLLCGLWALRGVKLLSQIAHNNCEKEE